MSYTKQTWDTNSYVNPTRMNHIEDGIDQALPKDGGSMTGDLTLGKASTVLKIRASGSRYTNLTSAATGSDKDIVLPNKSGTIALTRDTPLANAGVKLVEQITLPNFDISQSSETIYQNVEKTGYTPLFAIVNVNWYGASATATIYDSSYVAVYIQNVQEYTGSKEVKAYIFYA